jgi:hypothetical protein
MCGNNVRFLDATPVELVRPVLIDMPRESCPDVRVQGCVNSPLKNTRATASAPEVPRKQACCRWAEAVPQVSQRAAKLELLLTRQWHRLLEIQQLQTDLMEELVSGPDNGRQGVAP